MKVFSDLNVLSLGKYFYKLAEKSQDVFWIRDVDYKTQLYISPAYEDVWGLSCESLYANGISWFDTVHKDDREKVESQINQIKLNPQEEQHCVLEYRILRPDQTSRYIHEVCFPLFDAKSQFIGFAGIAKDITREKLRLAELEQASHYFSIFTKKVHAAFWARDKTSKQIYLSPGYEKIWGRSREHFYNTPGAWFESLYPDDREQALKFVEMRTQQNKGPDAQYEFRYRIQTPQSELRWIKDTSFPLYSEKNEYLGFAGIAEDITKEVLHEQELRAAIQRVEVANQAKADFLAMISHELRTPLNAILGMTQILKSRNQFAESQEYLDIINNAGNSLLSLVSDILDFARLEAGKLSFSNEPFNLQHLFSQVVQSIQHQAHEKGLDIKLDYDLNIPCMVMGDANRMRQVLVNLLSNAIKFTEKGGIQVKVNCIKKTKKKILYEITVIDTGIGIRAEKLVTIFDKFNQIDSIYQRKHRGIGLGLAITKELIEAMGGSIQVKSEYAKGSEFKFTLSLQLQALKETNHVITNVDVLQLERTKYHLSILLVEDNLINQKIAKIMLEDLGCSLDILDNGKDILTQMDKLLHYDLIFMDVGLPDISGFEIVSRLRQNEKLQHIPIVAMTAHILDRDRQQAFNAGMNQIIPKPISYDELERVLQQYSYIKNARYRGQAAV